MPTPSQTFSTIPQLLTYINTYFIPNGLRDISGDEGNNILNALSNFIVSYTLNSQLANINSSSGSVVVLAKPITVFTGAPTSIQWVDNIQFEYYIINATGLNINLSSGYSYIDQYGTSQTIIPARTSIHIAKGTNGSWIQLNNTGGGSSGTLPPQTGHQGEFLTTNGTTASWSNPFIEIDSSDFDPDGVTYTNAALVNNTVAVFFNDLNKFIYNEPGNQEWDYEVGGGIKILLPGFDANSNNYHFLIFLKGLN